MRWVAAFPHVARCSLRGQPAPPEVADLVGKDAAARFAASDHMPSYVALQLGRMLRDACDHRQLDRFAFLQIDRERALLIDHVGACERILNTPLPHAYAIKIRRFVVVFMVTLPFALLHQLNAIWLIPFITMLVASPVVSLGQIGVELQNPFCKQRLSHLPIGGISAAIERNARALPAELQDDPSPLLAETHRRQALSA